MLSSARKSTEYDAVFLFWQTREYKPQINADERRFVISTHRKGREERKAEKENINRSMGKSGNYINNELVRTETNSGHSKFGG